VNTKLSHHIGVISDTHIPQFKKLPDAIWERFANVELIIHAGDLSSLSVINELETIAPVVAVQGNVEYEEVVQALPIKREIVVGHCRPTRFALLRQQFPVLVQRLIKALFKHMLGVRRRRLELQHTERPEFR